MGFVLFDCFLHVRSWSGTNAAAARLFPAARALVN
jgi:hypothetical protein